MKTSSVTFNNIPPILSQEVMAVMLLEALIEGFKRETGEPLRVEKSEHHMRGDDLILEVTTSDEQAKVLYQIMNKTYHN